MVDHLRRCVVKVLTQKLVLKAIDQVLPALRNLVKNHTWGPLGLAIAVGGKGLKQPVVYIMEELGTEESWKEQWGDKNFRKIAIKKMEVSLRTGKESGCVVINTPWQLESGDFIYQGGVAEDTDLAVGISGAHGGTDEACAWIVWNAIRLECLEKMAQMRDNKQNRL